MKKIVKIPKWESWKLTILLVSMIVVIGLLSSCNKDDELSRTDLLVGQWRLEEIDGDRVSSSLIVEITFERDGDYEEEITDDGITGRNTGEWEWNSREDRIRVEYDQDIADMDVRVDRLTASILEMDDGEFELLFVKR